MKDLSDPELIALIARGDEEAFAVLHSRHNTIVRSILKAQGHSETEDVAQKVWLEVWDHAHTFNPNLGQVRSWISKIASHRGLDAKRRDCGYSGYLDRYGLEAEIHMPPVQPRSTGFEIWELAKQVLPPAQLEVIVMNFYEGLSQREIAAKLDKPLGTIKMRWKLGLDKMRAALAKRGEVAL